MGSHLFKKALPHLIALIVILGLNIIYFYPSLSGKVLEKSDSVAVVAMSKEVKDLQAKTGENVSLDECHIWRYANVSNWWI